MIDLRLGDCLEILPTLTGIDAVVTDPPYGVSGGAGGQAREKGKARYRSSLWDDTPEYIASVVVPALRRFIDANLRVAVTPGNRCLWLYPPPRDVGCFWSAASPAVGPWGFTTFHPILYYGRDPRAGIGAWPTGQAMKVEAPISGFPCAKPLNNWKWLIEKVTQPGETILDPFMGSGTTGVACVQTGRNFIGIEIDPTYFEIAKRRIADAQAQLAMPLEVAAS